MALNPKFTNEVANAEADAATALADNGYLRMYGGSQPATADDATAETLLAELRLAATAFGDAALGVCTANAITADDTANATGDATWFRVLKSDGTTPLWDGSVGLANADLIMNSIEIRAGAKVSVSSLTFTARKG